MSLYLFLIVVASLASGSVPAAEVPLKQCLVSTAGMILAWGVLSKTAALIAYARIQADEDEPWVIDRLERHLDLLRWGALAASLACLLLFNLAGAVQSWPLFRSSLSLQALVLLTPALSMIALTLWAEHQFGVAMNYTHGGWRNAVREVGGTLLRHVGWIAMPVVLMMLLADVSIGLGHWAQHTLAIEDWLPLTAMREQWQVWLPWWPSIPAEVVVGGGLMLLVPVLVPLVATRIWQTRPLATAEHTWLRRLVQDAGVPRLEIRVWDTGMRASNAVVVGFVPPLRRMLISDRLLRDYPIEQLRLIVLHELAHIKRWHIVFRIMAVLPGWGAAGWLVYSLGGGAAATLLGHAVGIVTTLVMLRYAAHVTEYDADRQACVWAVRLLNQAAQPVDDTMPRGVQVAGDEDADSGRQSVAQTTASEQAEQLCRALLRIVGSDAAAAQATWLHPSVDDRCLQLMSWAESVDGEVWPGGDQPAPYFNFPQL